VKPIDTLICPQCNSEGCGPYRCRFSGETHAEYRENKYASEMIRRDQEQPQWERDLKTGAGNG
jgi:hypothetical protein